MIRFARLSWQAGVAGRWTARVVGTLMVLFILAFAFGEGPPSPGRMTGREQLYALGMGSLFLGLIVAWFWEGWGGLLSVLGWRFCSVIARRPAWDLPVSIPAATGLLHLLCWWRLRGQPPPQEAANPAARLRVRTLIVVLSVSLGAFVLLCANEVFGQPPLMTRTGRPPAGIVGTWCANLARSRGQPLPAEIPVVLTIDVDGKVSGTIGNATVMEGRFTANRSWFGRHMKWRTDYLIRGALSRAVESYANSAGDRFSAPLNLKGTELDGSLFLSHPGMPKPLRLNLKKR